MPFVMEYRMRRADGQFRWVLNHGVPRFAPDGTFQGYIGSCLDITERKQMQAELEDRVQARTAELAETNRELEAFTYSVSHDLRSPLRHINAYAQILQEEFARELPEEAIRYIFRIRDGAKNMGTLVDDLLNLARVGRQELAREAVDINPIIQSIATDLTNDNPGRVIEWRIAQLTPTECDLGLIRQVFTNLLSNAVKYTRPRPVAVIEVGEFMKDNERAIFVKDNGVGFNQKYAAKLFGVFQRLHRAEEFEGTGVGLAIVERIIRKHSGRIWAEAELDKGAAFYFTLPTAAMPQHPGPQNGQTDAK
jgi:light-regulated signal transduction histidine kinase (bacteriophytochrome)